MTRPRRGGPFGDLTEPQRDELLGDGLVGLRCKFEPDRVEEFADLDEKRSAWAAHREELIADHRAERPGTRPAAFWTLDHDQPTPHDRLHEALALAELGELVDEERDSFGSGGPERVQAEHRIRALAQAIQEVEEFRAHVAEHPPLDQRRPPGPEFTRRLEAARDVLCDAWGIERPEDVEAMPFDGRADDWARKVGRGSAEPRPLP